MLLSGDAITWKSNYLLPFPLHSDFANDPNFIPERSNGKQTAIHTHSVEDTVSNLDNTKEIAYTPLCETIEYI